MTEATKLLQGSDKDFAVVRSTLIDSQATAKMLAENSANRRYRRALLGEARRIAHTLDTLDKMKAQHDALVAALKETMSALSDIINASETEPYTPEELQQNTFGKPVADAYLSLIHI